MMAFFQALGELLSEMAPWLLLGFFVAGVLHVFVPRVLFRRFLSGRNFRSVFWASMLGVPLPLCSCGVIPTAMGLRKDGASRGAAVSFLISTPQTGVDSILATWALLGLPFAIIRPVVSLVTGLVGGLLVNACVAEDADSNCQTAESPSEKSGCQCEKPGCSCGKPQGGDSQDTNQPQSLGQKIASMLRYGFVEMMQDIGKWLVVGLVLAACITVLVPDGMFAGLADRPWLGMLVILCVAAPMYICATGSIPIAAALMMKGFSPGAAFVLLMAGPATNLGALLIVGKVLGRKSLLLYLGTVLVGALVAGMGIDLCCPPEWFTMAPLTAGAKACAGCCQGGVDWWAWVKIASAALLVVLLVNALVLERWKKRTQTTSEKEEKMAENENTRKYRVTGMTCNHCRNFVEKSIKALDGVESVTVSLEDGTALVVGDVAPEAVKQAVEDAGFQCEAE